MPHSSSLDVINSSSCHWCCSLYTSVKQYLLFIIKFEDVVKDGMLKSLKDNYKKDTLDSNNAISNSWNYMFMSVSQITDIEYLSCLFFLIWGFRCNIFFLFFSIIPPVTMLWSWGYEDRHWDQSCLGLDSPIWNKDPKNMLYRSRFVKLFIISSYHVHTGHCR